MKPQALTAYDDGTAAADRALARHGAEELALAVAGDAGNGDDLAAMNIEGDVGKSGAKGLSAAALSRLIARRAGPVGVSSTGDAQGGDLRADHQAGETAGALLARVALGDHLAVAQHGGAVAEVA